MKQRFLGTYLACGSYPLFLGLAHHLDYTGMIE